MTRSVLRRRAASGARWLLQPWQSDGVALALVAAFAVPSLMAASADLFRGCVLVATHDDRVLERCDDVLHMRNGVVSPSA